MALDYEGVLCYNGKMDDGSAIKWGIVVSSRARLARNINGTLFPVSLKNMRQRMPVVRTLDKALKCIDGDTSNLYGFNKLLPRELNNTETAYYKEAGFLDDGDNDDESKEDALFLSTDEKLGCVVNNDDHIRISSITQGFSLEECYKRCESLEAQLGKYAEFAKSGEGFFVANVMEFPLGLKMSVRVNLINAFRMAKMAEVKKYLNRKGFLIMATYPEFSDDDYPAGCYFDISIGGKNQIPDCPKKNLYEIFESFNEACEYLDGFEKEQLDAVLSLNSDTVKNSALRAYSIMKSSLLLTQREVLDILSDIRVGAMMGLFKGVDYDTLYALLLLSQNAHLHQALGNVPYREASDSIKNKISAPDRFRAQLVQRYLQNVLLVEG